jgi:plasmid stabilization system protein ParE
VKYQLLVRRLAKADLERAAKWYEGQRPGLGKEFVGEVDAVLQRVKANPQQYQAIHRDVRHAVARRFPYGIFYRIEDANIVVFAIVHLLRDEALWKRRAGS